MIERLLLLGATGDLAGRFVLPALAVLRAEGRLPEPVRVVGAGEQDWDDATFRHHVDARVAEHAPDVPERVRADLLAGLAYRRVDLADPRSVARALATSGAGPGGSAVDGAGSAVAVYLALPPALFATALRSLTQVRLPRGSRVAVEKPFGRDLPSAVELNALLTGLTGDGGASASRIDHILGMPRVEDLLRLRGPGGALEALWDGDHLEQVDVLWEEILGLGARTDFYDRTGAVRDVLQNHLLQVLALVTMEWPGASGGASGAPALDPQTGADPQVGAGLQAAKAAALRAVRVPTADDVVRRTRRARYTAGTLVGPGGAPAGEVPAYAASAGVDPQRGTETHAELVLDVDTPRWGGTRFVVRTGKALAANRKGIALRLRPGVDLPGSRADGLPDGVVRVGERTLWIELDGPRGSLSRPHVAVNAPGELSAYGRVVGDVLLGGSATSVGAEEAELAWRIVDPVLLAWSEARVPLEEYPAGSAGPPTLDGPR